VAAKADVVGVAMGRGIFLSDVVTITGYGLGLWWCSGGPGWAALASMGCDELHGAIARRMGTTSESGAAMDWGADIALTPLALLRLSKDLNRPELAAVGAPVALAIQAKMKASNFRPPVLSARALVMLAALAVEASKKGDNAIPRDNPRGRSETRRMNRTGRMRRDER
jgi:hypothetical protein